MKTDSQDNKVDLGAVKEAMRNLYLGDGSGVPIHKQRCEHCGCDGCNNRTRKAVVFEGAKYFVVPKKTKVPRGCKAVEEYVIPFGDAEGKMLRYFTLADGTVKEVVQEVDEGVVYEPVTW